MIGRPGIGLVIASREAEKGTSASRSWPALTGWRRPRSARRSSSDPFVALAGVAAVTSTLTLGTGVCLVTERDPITTAKAVASLDRLSNGRFLFGVGAGWNRE